MDENTWYHTVDNINVMFKRAGQVNTASVGETLLSFFSCYLVRLCVRTRYEKQLALIREFIDDQNKRVYVPAGLCLTDPMERGLRVLEITLLGSRTSRSPSGRDLHSAGFR